MDFIEGNLTKVVVAHKAVLYSDTFFFKMEAAKVA